jgi:hypothetical protein
MQILAEQSRKLERYYDDTPSQLDVSAIVMNDTSGDMVGQSHAVLHKFNYTLSAAETERFIQQAIQDDPDYQKATTVEER